MAISIEDTVQALEDIRVFRDLNKFKKQDGDVFMQKYNIYMIVQCKKIQFGLTYG